LATVYTRIVIYYHCSCF